MRNPGTGGRREVAQPVGAETFNQPKVKLAISRMFDDAVTLGAASSDPVGFVGELPPKVILDEVQRAPALFTALKRAVDRDRRPGRFLLTGSANVLFVPQLADSLAGRMEMLRLHPLAQNELSGTEAAFLDSLFGEGFGTRSHARLGPELAGRIVAGGYPAALARATPRRRATWRHPSSFLVRRSGNMSRSSSASSSWSSCRPGTTIA